MHPSRTYEDWQAEQQADIRTPEERGIRIGSPVMWRHRTDRIITTERAIVLAIEDHTLTLQVKDVETRTCTVDIAEIVSSQFDRSSSIDSKRRAFYANQVETAPASKGTYSNDDAPDVGLLTVH